MLAKVLKAALIVLLLALVLSTEALRSVVFSWRALNRIKSDLLTAFLFPDLQWCAGVVVLLYFCAFLWMLRSFECERRGQSIGLAVAAFVVSGFWYLWHYRSASQPAEALVFLFGIALWAGAKWWQAWEGRQADPFPVSVGVAMTLGFLLPLGVVWHLPKLETFVYREQTRWAGAWDNPNMFGMLMATGVVLALGWLALELGNAIRKEETKHWYWSRVAFFAGVSVICGIGLIKSYSRGAWIGALCALGFLAVQFLSPQISAFGIAKANGMAYSVLASFKRRWFALAVLGSAVIVIGFWSLRHAEPVFIRRIVSAANANDFSSRNRIAAWQGALQMAAEKPLLGFGWNVQDQLYKEFYQPARLDAWRAIRTNDFLKLCNTLGIPALACFVALLLSVLLPDRRTVFDLSSVCRAGVIVLLAGLWFEGVDGGLFRLATGSLFWILLALGSLEESVESRREFGERSLSTEHAGGA